MIDATSRTSEKYTCPVVSDDAMLMQLNSLTDELVPQRKQSRAKYVQSHGHPGDEHKDKVNVPSLNNIVFPAQRDQTKDY
jgi:hypothetical protein